MVCVKFRYFPLTIISRQFRMKKYNNIQGPFNVVKLVISEIF